MDGLVLTVFGAAFGSLELWDTYVSMGGGVSFVELFGHAAGKKFWAWELAI